MTFDNNISFGIVKHSDSDLFEKVGRAIDEGGVTCRTVTLKFMWASGDEAFGDRENVRSNATVQDVFKQNTELVTRFQFGIDIGLSVVISRGQASSHDTLKLEFQDNLRSNADPHVVAVSHLLAALRRNLHPVDATGALVELLGRDVGEYYQRREAELVRLESLSANVTVKVTEFRDRLGQELVDKKTELEDEYRKLKQSVEAELAEERLAISEREAEVKRQLEDINNREARFARRSLQTDMKKKLADRAKEFRLSRGTQNLRWPVYLIVSVLLGLFFSGYIYYGRSFEAGDATAWSAGFVLKLARQLFFTASFITTAVFLLRWTNHWFFQHAQEEFRHKRFELDLERASWLIETAMEWQTEYKTPIPESLLASLSHDLFERGPEKRDVKHPAEQLALAIFGASASAKINLPGGGELVLDRKGVEKLEKKIQGE